MIVLVWIVLGLLAVAGAAFALLPLRGKNADLSLKSERDELQDEMNAVLRQITELERSQSDHEIDDADFARLKLQDETRAAQLLARIEALPANVPSQTITPRATFSSALGWLVGLSVVFAGLTALAVPALQHLALPADEAAYYDSSSKLLRLEANLHAQGNTPKLADLLEYGDTAWQMQDWDRAAMAYSGVLKQDKGNIVAVSRYGQLLFFAGQNDQALPLLQAAAKFNNPEAMLTLGNLLFSRNDTKGALAIWEKYQKLMGDKAEARVVQLIAAAKKRLAPSGPGEQSFAKNCAGCHGAAGEGISGTAPSLISSSNARDVAFVTRQVQTGSANKKMPAFPQITSTELAALVKYVTGLKQ